MTEKKIHHSLWISKVDVHLQPQSLTNVLLNSEKRTTFFQSNLVVLKRFLPLPPQNEENGLPDQHWERLTRKFLKKNFEKVAEVKSKIVTFAAPKTGAQLNGKSEVG